MMKNAKWTDIVTEEVTEEDKSDFEYNTPLPFSREQQPVEAPDDSGAGPSNPSASSQPEYDYLSYVAEYQNYMAQSAALMEGQERAKQLAQEAAAAGDRGVQPLAELEVTVLHTQPSSAGDIGLRTEQDVISSRQGSLFFCFKL